jgi:UDP-N-acetylglucosamine:LPS N-acetylglucosamine transferase
LATVVSDPVTVHASWATPRSDVAFVVSDEASRRLVSLGTPVDRVRRVAFPVHPELLRSSSRSEARGRLSLPNDLPIALVAGGGAGSGHPEDVAGRLRAAGWPGAIVVAVGTNRRLERRTRDFARTLSDPKSVFDAVRSADVFVTKAGPSAIFEAAAVGVPLVVTKEIGRQEQGNVEFAERTVGATRWQEGTAEKLSRSAASLHNRPREPRHMLTRGAIEIARDLLSLVEGRAPGGTQAQA